ncbi:hypothetical protein [Synechococcus sp. RS9916]|uniref:hypothetical protein n=1 Tax=Synechococcus sp. RS9916 TaxID=221359 RepID=UPI0012E9F8FA|nr:hypothetical protein [Synechococcus sp. RS9916]
MTSKLKVVPSLDALSSSEQGVLQLVFAIASLGDRCVFGNKKPRLMAGLMNET